MATYYVNSAASAGGDGSEGSPFDSLADLSLTDGDTAYLRGTFRGETLAATGLTGVTIENWPGHTAELRGDDGIAAGSWTDNADGTFSATVNEEPASVVWNWDGNTDANGFHYGHLTKAADLASCQSTDGSWFWATNTLTVNPPTGAQDPDTGDTYAWCKTGNCIALTNATNCKVQGLTFKLWPDNNASNGMPVVFFAGEGCIINNCTAWDSGYHAFSMQGNKSVNNRISNCTAYGQAAGSVLLVFYGGTEDVTGCVGENNTLHCYSLLKWDGSALASGIVGGAYSHASPGTSSVVDVEWRNCTFQGYESDYASGGLDTYAVTGADTSAPGSAFNDADRRNWRKYPIRVVDCTFTNFSSTGNTSMHIAYVRLKAVDWTDDTGDAFDTTASRFRVNSISLFESCEIAADQTAETEGRLFGIAADAELYLLNNTIIDETPGTPGNRCVFRWVSTAYIACYGTVFARRETGYLIFGQAVDFSRVDFTGNWYVGIEPSSYASGLSTYKTKTEWQANVDLTSDGARYEDTDLAASDTLGFVDRTTDLRPSATGDLRHKRWGQVIRADRGTNGRPYGGQYGAWQYGSARRKRIFAR